VAPHRRNELCEHPARVGLSDRGDDPVDVTDREGAGELGVVGVAEAHRDPLEQLGVVEVEATVRIPVDHENDAGLGEVPDEVPPEAAVAEDDGVDRSVDRARRR
jgi:hypothetical protein